MECKCMTTGKKNAIYFCPLHKAAPEMYKALKVLFAVYDINDWTVALKDTEEHPVSWTKALEAIDKAEGR